MFLFEEVKVTAEGNTGGRAGGKLLQKGDLN